MRLGSVAATLSAVLLVLSACQDRAAAPSAPAMAPSSPAAVETTAATRAVSPSAQVNGPERHILAFGDSLFAGYRLREDEGYPEQLEATLRARGVNARVTDAGVSGDTTAGGRQRIAFVLGSLDMAPDLALVELGGNDLLRGIPPAETRANLTAILTSWTSARSRS
jgi:acyl-CoA thioesterase-1